MITKQTLELVGHEVRNAFRASCQAGRMAFPDNLAGACAPATAALMSALAAIGVPSTWAHGTMSRPSLFGPHTWAHVGEFFVDLTATQSNDTSMAVAGVRIVTATSRAYRVEARGASFGPILDVPGYAEQVGAHVSAWYNEAAIVDVVCAATKRSRGEIEPHVCRVLWGDKGRRNKHATPAIILSEMWPLLGTLSQADARALVGQAKKMAARKSVAADVTSDVRVGPVAHRRVAGDVSANIARA